MTANIRCTAAQFLATLAKQAPGTLQRQTPEEPDALDAGSFLDLLADIDAYNAVSAGLIAYRIETSVVPYKDTKRMPCRTAQLVLAATRAETLSKNDLERLARLFAEYTPEPGDIDAVLHTLADATK
jgi:hypothetical protein